MPVNCHFWEGGSGIHRHKIPAFKKLNSWSLKMCICWKSSAFRVRLLFCKAKWKQWQKAFYSAGSHHKHAIICLRGSAHSIHMYWVKGFPFFHLSFFKLTIFEMIFFFKFQSLRPPPKKGHRVMVELSGLGWPYKKFVLWPHVPKKFFWQLAWRDWRD